MMKDVLVCSFYTNDEYYIKKADDLVKNLNNLGVSHIIEIIEIPEGKSWPDICRLKINYIREIYLKNSDKKVFWIDVDCSLQEMPSFVTDSSADIIGFQRGFQIPLRIGYHYKTRFWEPCFLGFNQTESTRKFLQDASRFEREFTGRATDDYFFEEAWRLNASRMSFQVIPSGYAFLEGRKVSDYITPFFYFGASGNVSNYVDMVVQHSVPWLKKSKSAFFIDTTKKAVKSVVPLTVIHKLKYLKAKKKSIDITLFKKQAFEYGKKGDGVKLEGLIARCGGHQYISDKHKAVIKLAYSFLYYKAFKSEASASSPILLAWWHLPEPGNFGDWLSPYIINKMTSRAVVFAAPGSKKIPDGHIFSVGSIGKFIKDNSIVLGTGISMTGADLNPNADYRMVRGPYTRDRVIESGGKCSVIYGDPAVVLPLIYKPNTPGEGGVSSNILLIRHFKHAEVKLRLPANVDEKSIYASHPSEIEDFIDDLHAYSGVVTSAMHVFITCQAYGIPCALVSFEGYQNAVHGDGVKYKDYLSCAGMVDGAPEVIPCDLLGYDFERILQNHRIEAEVIQNVFDVMRNTLKEVV